MSILIKGMEMPTRCGRCDMRIPAYDDGIFDHYECCITAAIIDNLGEKMEDCPLVPVLPHGRLIEESKVLDIVFEWCPDDDGSVGKVGDIREMLDEIEALPTIIPASEEGE